MECISVTIAEAVRLTGLPRTSIYQLLREQALVSYKYGRRRLITVDSIQRFVANQLVKSEPSKLKPACRRAT